MKNFYMSIILLICFGILYSDESAYSALEIKKISASASSILFEEKKPKSMYEPLKAFDYNFLTAWCADNQIQGEQYIQAEFQPVGATAILVMNGISISKSIYSANNRIKDYELQIGTPEGNVEIYKGSFKDNACGDKMGRGETAEELCNGWVKDKNNKKELEKCITKLKNECIADSHDNFGGELVILKKPICVKSMKLIIKKVYPGLKHNDTCVSEIRPVLQDPINLEYSGNLVKYNASYFKNCPADIRSN